jgi:hypothetical protein
MALFLYAAVAVSLGAFLRRAEKVSPRIALVLALLPLCLTGRAILTGRVYAPVDLAYAAEPLASQADAAGIIRSANPNLSDVYSQFMPWHAAVRYALSHGEWPLWNPFELGGSILAGAVQAAPFHPLHILALLLPLAQALTFIATMLLLLAASSAFLLAREMVESDSIALFAAAAWMYSSYLLGFVGTAHGLAMATMPLVLLGASRIVRRPGPASAALLTAALTMTVLAGHPESVLHIVVFAVLWFLFELRTVRPREWRRVFALGLGAGVLTLLFCAIVLLPLFEAIPQTEEWRYRSGGYTGAHERSGPALLLHEFVVAFVPAVEGAPGDESASHPKAEAHGVVGTPYAGALLFAPALYGAWRTRKRARLFFGAAMIWGVLAGFNAPGAVDLLERLPLFSVAVNDRMVAFAVLGTIMLAVLGLEAWGSDRGSVHARLLPLFFVGTALSIIAAAAILFPSMTAQGLSREFIRVSLIREVLPLVLAGAAVTLIRQPRHAVSLLFVLLLIQRAGETSDARPIVERRAFFPPFTGLETMRAAEPFRIVAQGAILPPDIAAHYELEDVRGFEAMTLGRFTDTFPLWSIKQPVWSNRVDDLTAPFLSLLNVRFALAKPDAPTPAGWRRLLQAPGYSVLENERVLPRAFVPHQIHLGVPERERLAAMQHCSDFGQEAWIESGSEKQTIANGPGRIEVRRDGTGLVLHAHMAGGGWAVISQPNWKGWQIAERGSRLRIRFADQAFLAVYLPQGDHELVLSYVPRGFVLGALITALTAAGLTLAYAIRHSRASRLVMPSPVTARM